MVYGGGVAPQVPAIAGEHLRPVDRPQRLVTDALGEPHRPALDRGAAGLARHVADGRRRGHQHRLAGDPGHLQKRVDRAVERQGAVKQPLGGGARDDLPDRAQGRRVRAHQGERAAAGDRRPVADRRCRHQHIVPRRPFGGHELDQRREWASIDFGVVFEHHGEVELVVDDPPPGRAVAKEDADFRRRQRERIARTETAGRIGLVDFRLSKARSIDRRDDLARDRQLGAQGPDVGCSRNRALQVENKGFGSVQDWLTGQRPAIIRAKRARERLDTRRSAPSHPGRRRRETGWRAAGRRRGDDSAR